MSPWTRLLAVACALGGLLAEGRTRRGSDVSLVPHGAFCGPCDIRACPYIQADSCPGLVVKDECNCCPVCQASLTSDIPHEDLNFTSSKNESEGGCASVKCPRMQICMHNIQGLPLCRCPSVYHCRQFKRKPLCGRDGKTYKNRCYLQMNECSQGKKIRVAYMDKCRGDGGGLDKEELKMKRKERRKNRKQIKKQKRKDQRKIDAGLTDNTEDFELEQSKLNPPSLSPLGPKESPADNSLTKKERRKQRRKERRKRLKLKRREKKRRERRRLRRSCALESQ